MSEKSGEQEETEMDATGAVVVGVDGSPQSGVALEHALEEAARRGALLRVIAAVPAPEYWGPAYGMGSYGMGTPLSREQIVADVQAATQRTGDELVASRAELAAGVEISVEARMGVPAEVLIEASDGAAVLVLGHRGRGALSSALLGSVGLACVLHATCPVTVVRTPPGTR